MRHLDLTVFEPGDTIATMSKDGKVAVFTVSPLGEPVSSPNGVLEPRLSMDEKVEVLNLSARTYNLLKRNGVTTLREMLHFYDQGEDAISEIRNFGQKSIDEVREHVQRLRGERAENTDVEAGA